MRASSKRARVQSSGVAPLPPSSTDDTMVEEFVDLAATAAAADVLPPSTSDDSDIRRILGLL